jgi:phosphoribosylanthranilate isomerase
MFQIKICGITNVEDAQMAAEAGADAIGLNFYAGSRRFVAIEQAAKIALSLPLHVQKVGVFVNASAAEVLRICDAVGLDAIQLHGDEPPQFLGELNGKPIIKAFRLQGPSLKVVADYIKESAVIGDSVRMVLVDAFRPGVFGGTGERLDWQALDQWKESIGVPLVLAGGLTAQNVDAAISTARPAAVDTASGVETMPGIKDGTKVREFVDRARTAFTKLA